jgi:AraC family transcriptional regulator
MNHQRVSPSRFGELLQSPPKLSGEWSPFSLQVVESPLHATASFSDYALGLYVSGRHRIRRKIGGNVVEGWSDPGTLNMTPPGITGTWDATGSSRAVVLFIPKAFVLRVISEHWEVDPRHVEIVPQFLVRDPVVEAVMTRLAFEAKNESPSGKLYAESACEFLAGHLIHAYSTLSSRPPRRSGGLSGRRLKLVLEYIEENLAQPIALRQLAELAGVSARHFERAFRQAIGRPPHAHVLERRFAAARNLLLCESELDVQEIAVRTGFSSASHLAAVFRRSTGYSPTAFRELFSH